MTSWRREEPFEKTNKKKDTKNLSGSLSGKGIVRDDPERGATEKNYFHAESLEDDTWVF